MENTITIEEQKKRLETAINNMVNDPDIIAIVKSIESDQFKTTKGGYGRYMAALSPFAADKVSMFVVSRAMLRLGADPYGVSWAIKLILG
jgi:hypothetical protein